MAITIRNVIDNIKTELADSTGEMFGTDDAQALRYIIGNLTGTEQTFTFQKVAEGYWTINVGRDCLFYVGTPFADGGDTVVLDSGTDTLDPFISRSAGSALGDTISVTATRCHYADAIAAIAQWRSIIADQQEDQLTMDGQTITGSSKGDKLRRLARRKTGAKGI